MSGENDNTTFLLIIICSSAIVVFICIIPMLLRMRKYLIRSRESHNQINLQILTEGSNTMVTVGVVRNTDFSSLNPPPPFHTAVKMPSPVLRTIRRDLSVDSQEFPPPYNENMKTPTVIAATHLNESVKYPINHGICEKHL